MKFLTALVILILSQGIHAAGISFNGNDASFSIKYPGCDAFMIAGSPPRQELKCMVQETVKCSSVHGAGPAKGQCIGYNEVEIEYVYKFTDVDGKKITIGNERIIKIFEDGNSNKKRSIE